MRGRILTFDPDTGGGLISGDDGRRYAFSEMDVRGDAPTVGSTVDFLASDNDYAREIVASAPTPEPLSPNDYAGEDLSLWGYFLRAVTRRYADGRGRARRKEYWGFTLFGFLFAIVPVGVALIGATALDPNLETESSAAVLAFGFIVFGVLMAALVIPSITVAVRRLHDVGMSGWLYLLQFVPFGGIFLFVVALMPSQPHANIYGAVPLPPPEP